MMNTIFGPARGATFCVIVALLLAGVTVGAAQAEISSGEVVKVDARWQTVEFGGGTAQFAAQLTVGPDGRASGPVLILILGTAAGEDEKRVLRVQEGWAAVDSTGKVTDVAVVGKVLDADGHPHGDFRARVTPSADMHVPDCLIFDLDGANVTGRVVAEGTMEVLADPTDDDPTR